MVQYYKPIYAEDGSILSIDNVRIDFEVDTDFSKDFSLYLGTEIQFQSFPISLKDFRFKYMWNAVYDNGSVMNLGYCFNGTNAKVDGYKGYVDFNPNKTGSSEMFWRDLAFIRSCCWNWTIKRVDIALDVKVPRQQVVLEKDNRKFGLEAYSLSNKTEYLGKRSNVGFVKVYNKQEESKLDYALTRIEVTCEPNSTSYFQHFPNVYALRDTQIDMSSLSLNDTDLAIINMELALLSCNGDPGIMIFNSISRRKKEKLKQYILPELSRLVVLRADVENLLSTNLMMIRK